MAKEGKFVELVSFTWDEQGLYVHLKGDDIDLEATLPPDSLIASLVHQGVAATLQRATYDLGAEGFYIQPKDATQE